MFNSVISPSPEIRLISRSFLPMVSAKPGKEFADEWAFFPDADGLAGLDIFGLDFIKKRI
jgi:hypothetical protein